MRKCDKLFEKKEREETELERVSKTKAMEAIYNIGDRKTCGEGQRKKSGTGKQKKANWTKKRFKRGRDREEKGKAYIYIYIYIYI